MGYELKEGKYPGGTQEIAAGRAFFRAMGYDDVKVGETDKSGGGSGMVSFALQTVEDFINLSHRHMYFVCCSFTLVLLLPCGLFLLLMSLFRR